MMVETLGNIASHLDMLDLITTHRHLMRVKNENVCRHQYGVRKQPHRHAKIGVFARDFIRLYHRFISMGSIH